MKTIYLILFSLLIITLSYCSKSNGVPSSIIGKWKVDSVQLRYSFPDHVEYVTIYKPTADYYDFRADNKLYRYWMGNYDTITYQMTTLNNKSLIQYPGTADTILTLTANYLTVKDPQGSDSKIFLAKY